MAALNYEPNILDEEFEHFWDKVSCYAANSFPFEERCEFVKKATSCNKTTNVVPYMRILACDLNIINMFQEAVVLAIIVAFCIEIVILLVYVCYSFYTPALKAVAKYLHLNEHLAGVTLLAFGNTSADLFTNLSNIYNDIPMYGNSMASAVFVVLVSGGLVCFLTPFQMNAYMSGRDTLCLILASSLLSYFIMRNGQLNNMECWIMILIYITYILANVIEVFLLRYTMRTIDTKLYALMDEPYTPEIELKLQELEKKQDKYKVDGRVEIYERRSRMRSLSRMQYTTKRTVCRARVSVNMRKTKYELYDSEAPQNRGLYKMFFMGLRPINCRKWRKAYLLERTYLVIQAPAVLLCHIIIPVVDCELNKHGWNKLLNCIQVMVNPAVTIVVLQAILLSRGPQLWYVQLNYTYISGLYSLIITTPIAFFFLYTTRTDVPPQFHWIFTVLSLTGSMTIIFLCATEINTAMEVIGQIIKVKSDFMSATVQACTANLEALISNTAMARDGYPKMAFASSIGGPLFSVIVCISLLMLIRNFIDVKYDKYRLMGMYGQMAYIFLLIALCSTLIWSTTLGFFARRSVGLFSLALYLVYLLFAVLIHSEVIHSFNEDKPVRAAIGDI